VLEFTHGFDRLVWVRLHTGLSLGSQEEGEDLLHLRNLGLEGCHLRPERGQFALRLLHGVCVLGLNGITLSGSTELSRRAFRKSQALHAGHWQAPSGPQNGAAGARSFPARLSVAMISDSLFFPTKGTMDRWLRGA